MLPQCPGWLSGKESAASAGDLASTPGWEDRLEKAMATHSSILAWEILRREVPGRLQPTGSQKDWDTILQLNNNKDKLSSNLDRQFYY